MASIIIRNRKLAVRKIASHLLFIIFFLTSISPSLANAAPGDLDLSFGNGTGKVTTSIGISDDKINSLAIQPDGKLVAAGYSHNGIQNKFAVARYNTNGSLDATFGAGGIVTTAPGTADDRINALVIQADGKLVAAGYSYNGSHTVFALARYKTDGSLDNTFGTGGLVITAVGTEAIAGDNAFALAIQPDGKLVAAGYSTSEGVRVFALVRYNTGGSLDTTFGTAGIVKTNIGADARSLALGIQTDGKLVAGGVTLGNNGYDFALARYNADGSLDTTFGTGGIVTTDFANNDDDAKALAIQSNGKPVLAGFAFMVTQRKFPLARYNTNGTLDSSFGTGGLVTTAIGTTEDKVKALAIQPDGKLIAAGFSNNGSQYEFALVRYNTNGSLDTTFGTGGIITTTIGTVDDEANALVIQPDGKLVAAGYSYNGLRNQFALVRYLGNSITGTTTTIRPTTTTTVRGTTTTTTRPTTTTTVRATTTTRPTTTTTVRATTTTRPTTTTTVRATTTTRPTTTTTIRATTTTRRTTTTTIRATTTTRRTTTTTIRATTTTRPTTTTTVRATTTTRPTTTTTVRATTTTRPTTTTTVRATTTTRPTTTTTVRATTTTRPTTTTTVRATTTTTTSTTTTTIRSTPVDVGIREIKGVPDKVGAGEIKKVEVKVKNFSKNSTETRTLSLFLNGMPVNPGVSITLKKDQEINVKYDVLFNTPGPSMLLAVLSPIDASPANDTNTLSVMVEGTDVGIREINGVPKKVDVGKPTKVEVKVRNYGKTTETRTLSLLLNGRPVGSGVAITLEKDKEINMKYDVLFNTPGTSTLQAILFPTDTNPGNDTETLIVVVDDKDVDKDKDKDKSKDKDK